MRRLEVDTDENEEESLISNSNNQLTTSKIQRNYIISLASLFIFIPIFVLLVIYIFSSNDINDDYNSSMQQLPIRNNIVVEHWCKDGTDTTCSCAGFDKQAVDYWMEAHRLNIIDIETSIETVKKLDVVFLGDSITEEWNGRWMGHYQSRFENIPPVFQKYFMDNDLNGLALGIAGDKCPDLLWRLKNGELPQNLKSNVFWILIGTNDLLKGCDKSSVLYYTIQIINEIHKNKPKSKIVINSIFPSGSVNLLSSSNIIWQDTMYINEKLFEYSEIYNDLYFFNGTGLFLDYGDDGVFVRKDVMPDYLHPTNIGHTLWAEAIVDFIHNDVYI